MANITNQPLLFLTTTDLETEAQNRNYLIASQGKLTLSKTKPQDLVRMTEAVIKQIHETLKNTNYAALTPSELNNLKKNITHLNSIISKHNKMATISDDKIEKLISGIKKLNFLNTSIIDRTLEQKGHAATSTSTALETSKQEQEGPNYISEMLSISEQDFKSPENFVNIIRWSTEVNEFYNNLPLEGRAEFLYGSSRLDKLDPLIVQLLSSNPLEMMAAETLANASQEKRYNLRDFIWLLFTSMIMRSLEGMNTNQPDKTRILISYLLLCMQNIEDDKDEAAKPLKQAAYEALNYNLDNLDKIDSILASEKTNEGKSFYADYWTPFYLKVKGLTSISTAQLPIQEKQGSFPEKIHNIYQQLKDSNQISTNQILELLKLTNEVVKANLGQPYVAPMSVSMFGSNITSVNKLLQLCTVQRLEEAEKEIKEAGTLQNTNIPLFSKLLFKAGLNIISAVGSAKVMINLWNWLGTAKPALSKELHAIAMGHAKGLGKETAKKIENNMEDPTEAQAAVVCLKKLENWASKPYKPLE